MRPKKSWWLLLIVSLGVVIPFVAPYITLNPAKSRVPITSTAIQFPLLIAHIVTACVALIAGFFQFIERIRIKTPGIHRYLGRIYVGSVMISGALALAVIFYIENFAKATSFLALALTWLFTSWKGYRSAVRKRFGEHRKWMIRSFGITLVAVSGRLLVPVLLLAYYTLNGFSLPGGREKMVEEVLNVNIWAGLLLNFIIIEWIVLKSAHRLPGDS
ncbi:membrane protein [Gordoniibacillus kamchatkensis]|uniref:Membrane protein n=1 Tax=Gordoniibacillus kamchatkensis TaxID=1590651 RepID=A0ABR5AEQ8_9BACL|nr:DUF2306 domain-containing protein [Paenibacillus sp. VKM B-2647]KIL39540.1 membrane protein [Paenibacillus sp. VKM B-2647]